MVKLLDVKSWVIWMSEDGCVYKFIGNYKCLLKVLFFMVI